MTDPNGSDFPFVTDQVLSLLASTDGWVPIVVDTNGARIRWASQGVGSLLGLATSAVEGSPLSDVVVPSDAALLLEHGRTGSAVESTVSLRHALGDTISARARCHGIREQEGADVIAIVVAFRGASSEWHDELDRYFDIGLDLHCIADTDGHFRRLSTQWERTLGFSREQLLGARFLDFVHPDDVGATEQAMASLRKQEAVLNFENRYRCHDGTYRWLEWRSLPVGGTIYAVARDVTERRKMEEEFRDNREQLRRAGQLLESVLNAIPDVIGIQDLQHGMLRCNRAGHEYLGIAPGTEVGRRCYELIGRTSPCEDCATTTALRTGRPTRLERYSEVRGVWLDCRSYPVPGPLGKTEYIVEHLRDVTELKVAQQELLATEQRLAHGQKMEAIGQLAGGIAHDFNNQLAGIMGNGDLLRLALEDQPELHKLAEDVVLAARRASDLTAQLLAFAHKGKYQQMGLDLHHIIDEVVSILKHSIDKRIRISHQLNASPSTTLGDPTQIQNALLNLALNARDAMSDGGELAFGTCNVDIDDGSREIGTFELTPGRYVRVTVIDSGSGIPLELQGRIFEPFFTTKGAGKGTGMGLAAVYGTMQHHGGAVRVISKPSEGSTFELYLPATAPSEEKRVKADTLPPTAAAGLHVLLVDDEPMVRAVARRMLSHLGHRVTQCEDGHEAVERYRDMWSSIDVVILDMMMPRMDGLATFTAMQAINPRVVVLVSSGYSIDENVQSVLDRGAAGVVPKPFTMRDLSSKIDGALRAAGFDFGGSPER